MRWIPLILLATLGCDESSPALPADTNDATTATDATTASDATTTPETDATAAPETVDSRCGALVASCITRQRTCVIDDGEPTCRACPDGHFPERPSGTCIPMPGTRLAHDFGEQTIAVGQEIGSLCQSWILDNDEEIWVNAVELDNDGGYHHSNWFFVPEGYNDWPTEPWINCYSEGFHEIDAALAGGVLYAQSTQVRHELQKFQPGAAVHIPPRSRIISVTHLLNYNITPLTTGLRLSLYTLPRADVTIPLTPAQLIYSDLEIPALARSRFGATCDLATPWSNVFPTEPFAMKLHYVLPHYHALGAGFELTIVGGPRDGERIVDLGAFSSDPFGFAFDPPLDLAGATGLDFGCTFQNPTAEEVRWGIGDQEMCEALLFFESPLAFSAGVTRTSADTVMSGDVEQFTGTCNVAAFPFDPRD